eukprot:TRINITY_DN30568_c0_g1_i1.p1 TRINITY_DN30568_c0_g1~~TRINITY_DN30568_c0_g1_i1.p1  ORF type:complete len:358 (-),score=11.60 TRINITY_DN30568_c0_g1_i1:108-1181(-)
MGRAVVCGSLVGAILGLLLVWQLMTQHQHWTPTSITKHLNMQPKTASPSERTLAQLVSALKTNQATDAQDTLAALIDQINSLQGQNQTTRHQASTEIDSAPQEPKRGFTALINVYSRPWNIFPSVAACIRSEFCAAVRILMRSPSEITSFGGPWSLGDVILFRPDNPNNLNSRFYPIKNIPTEAVLSIDDDCIMKSPEIDKMYLLWEAFPDRIVGPNCRSALKGGKPKYVGNVPCCNANMVVLTSFAFFHRKYLQMYTDTLPKHLWDFVTKNNNCEDIFMNALVTNYTKKPAMPFRKPRHLVVSEVQQRPKSAAAAGKPMSALSARGDHYQQRTHCVAMAQKSFEHAFSPLKPDTCH